MLLCDFVYKRKIFVEKRLDLNNSNTTEIYLVEVNAVTKPDWDEYLLLVWAIAFFGEEIRQVID